jgi:hypothetical protein
MTPKSATSHERHDDDVTQERHLRASPDGSCPNCASALQGARETANIQARSGVIWRIPVNLSLHDRDIQ